MRHHWIRWGRALWVLLALNSFVLFGLTLWVTLQFLQTPSARMQQGLAQQGLALELYAAFFLISIPVYFLVFFVVALLIFLRRPNDGFALFTAIFLLNFGASSVLPETAEFSQFSQNLPLWYYIPLLVSSLFSWTLLTAFLVVYPDGHFVPRWSLLVAVYGFFLTAAWSIFPNVLEPTATPLGIFGTVSVLGLTSAALYVQFWRYRHYFSATQRQQAKWFLFGLAVFTGSTFAYFLSSVLTSLVPNPAESIMGDLMLTLTGSLSFVLIPITVGIAILRYRLWDIDLIIRKTVTYALLGALLGIIYFSSIILLQQAFVLVIGHRSEIITVLSTLGIAALFVPLRNRIQDAIDKRFYRKKYDAQQVLNDFAETVRDETDLEKLTGRLIQVVDETMQPKSVSVWLRR